MTDSSELGECWNLRQAWDLISQSWLYYQDLMNKNMEAHGIVLHGYCSAIIKLNTNILCTLKNVSHIIKWSLWKSNSNEWVLKMVWANLRIIEVMFGIRGKILIIILRV